MVKGSGSLRASAYMKGVFSMTNEQIILFNRIQLMKDGVIGTTGNQICIEDEEGNKESWTDYDLNYFKSKTEKGNLGAAKFYGTIVPTGFVSDMINKWAPNYPIMV